MTGPTRRDALSGAAALAACLAASSRAAASVLPLPSALTSEHGVGLIGLEAPRPRLAWTPPVTRQSAWRVQVAASEADLLAGRLTWDSGKIVDPLAAEAVYDGPPLSSRARRVWRVRLWDAAGQPGAWSGPAHFEMGLLASEDWGDAAWIGRYAEPPRGWADLTLDVDFTLKGRFFDVLFRARPEGKTYGEAYVLRVGQVDDKPSLMLQVRQYPGGTSPQVKLRRLQVWPLPIDPKGQRHRLTVEAMGASLRFSLDGQLVGALEDATQAEGTFGFLAPEAEAATIHAVALKAPDRSGFESRFEGGDNPFTGGDVGADGLILASGVPGKDIVVPLVHPAPLLRRAFAVQGEIASARLYVAAGGFAALSLNGEPLGESALATGWTAYDKRVLYQALDVTAQLKAGDNLLAAELARGWYGVAEPNEWYFHKAPWTAEPVLKARLEIVLTDGSTQVLVTDTTWRTADGPCLWDSIYAGERRDARRDPVVWDAARVARGPTGRLVAAVHEPIAPLARHAAVSVKEVKPDVWLFDFGRIRTGIPELSVTGPSGRTVSMVLAEKLRKDGAIQVASGLIDAQLMTWRYTLAGKGREIWRPAFGYGGFRYVQVTGLDGTPPADTITAVEIHSAVASIGRFECSEPLVNDIHDAARQALLNNLHAAQTDTPSLEKNGWTGDAQASATAAALNFDVVRSWEKWLNDFVDAQAPSGELPEIVPSTPLYGFENTPGWNYIWGPTPAWDVAAFILPEELELRFGVSASAPVREMQKRLADYTAGFLKAPEYRYDHGLGEYAAAGPTGPIDATSTAYVFHMLKATGQAELAAKVRAAYNARYWDAAARRYVAPPEGGKPAPYIQTMNVLPVALGLVPDGQAKAVIDGLAADIVAKGYRLDVGVYALRYLPLLLSDHGHGEIVWNLVTRTDEPSWGFWLKNDLRSMPEGWGLSARSWNHHYFASISSWFYEGLAGLRSTAPGYAALQVRPVMPKGLNGARGALQTPRGEARSRWVRAKGAVTLEVGIPGACQAEVWLPNGGERLARPPSGARWLGRREDHAVYGVGPGTWTFSL
ncbi:alpha-L-rhamnosidase [Caulobacter sp. RHG1]|uniref:alpha-L-rhamnosidase n=1 Tax=Caulobacter sp. (strain RHG1) TaxID=2545762 RepID=UPI001554EED8|nr:alpha-L-rhamnosidase [Caulobacter sp. RHG1]NQE64034.1 hypothetical protein [Caulobacter sp. RHG1]